MRGLGTNGLSARVIGELKILGRERLRVPDFLLEQQRAGANQRHFGEKNVTLPSF